MLWKLIRREEGQDMMEYALLASLISVVAVASIVLLAPLIIAMFDAIVAAMT